MSSPRTFLSIATLAGGLALASASPVQAPGHTGYRVLRPPFSIPSDAYLDVGAPRLLPTEASYTSPPHVWQEAARFPLGAEPVDETLYLDVGAPRSRSTFRQRLAALLGRAR